MPAKISEKEKERRKDERAAQRYFSSEIKKLERQLEANRKPAEKLEKEIQELHSKLQHLSHFAPVRSDLKNKLRELEYNYEEIRAKNHSISMEIAKLEQRADDY